MEEQEDEMTETKKQTKELERILVRVTLLVRLILAVYVMWVWKSFCLHMFSWVKVTTLH